MKETTRHQIVWNILRAVMIPFTRLRFGYRFEKCDAPGKLLVAANHTTDWDPILLGVAFPRYMAFVASEHIFRWGKISKLISYLVAPISRLKGSTAVSTVMAMLRRLKNGDNVAIFPEGNRSFTGTTEEIQPVIGKLVKNSGATLVTYRFHGGYFLSPRWAGSAMRRGRITGEVAGVYPPETLQGMTPAQVYDLIQKDLWVDAYADQAAQKQRFTAKAPAEHLERLLCLCPKCGRLDTLTSQGDTLSCGCGFAARFTEYGLLEGDGIPADNIPQWDRQQREALCAMADKAEDIIFSDSDMELTEVLPDHTTGNASTGSITLRRDALEVCGVTLPLSAISGISLHGSQTMDLAADGKNYEIRSGAVRCTRKYLQVIEYLKKASAN